MVFPMFNLVPLSIRKPKCDVYGLIIVGTSNCVQISSSWLLIKDEVKDFLHLYPFIQFVQSASTDGNNKKRPSAYH